MTVDKEIQINIEPNILFNILKDPRQIPLYYPYKKVESDHKVGGSFTCYGVDEKGEFVDKGVIEKIDSPVEFRYSYWSTNHGTEDSAENHLKITYVLEPNPSGTNLRIKHENIHSKEYYSVMEGAWNYLLNNLKSYAERPKGT